MAFRELGYSEPGFLKESPIGKGFNDKNIFPLR